MPQVSVARKPRNSARESCSITRPRGGTLHHLLSKAANLFAKPVVGRILVEPLVPHHVVIESANLRGSCQPLDGSRFGMGERQSARNGEDHVSVCNGRDRRREEGERETDFSSSGEIGQGAVHESRSEERRVGKECRS